MKKKLQKRQIFRFFSALLCLIVVFILTCISNYISNLLDSQKAGERWQGNSDTKFAQVSVFFKQDEDFNTSNIQSLHESIEESLKSASLEAGSDSSRLWYDCYSTQGGEIEITGSRKNSAKALVTAVGGDFFTMHMPELADGSYFQDSDIMHDRVVIDTTLAWQLFGSSQVAGMELTIQQKTCFIAGVVKPETNYASQTAYGDTPRIYMSYLFYQELSSDTKIDCYEAVLPNPVKNFAKNTISELINSESNITILQNTDRYSLSGRFENLKHIRNFVVAETVTYPYWENSARIICFDTAMLLFLMLLFLIYPVFYFIWLCWKAYCFIDSTIWQKRQAYKNRYRSQISS